MQAISYFLTAAEKHLLLLIIIIVITIIVIIIIIIPYTFSILSKFYSPPKQTIRLVSPIEKYCFMVKTIILHPASFETNTFINVCLSCQLNPSCVYKCRINMALILKDNHLSPVTCMRMNIKYWTDFCFTEHNLVARLTHSTALTFISSFVLRKLHKFFYGLNLRFHTSCNYITYQLHNLYF